MKFGYKPGSCITVDADIAGAMCKQLEQTVGLTAQNLLDANRDADAPLHDAFEWDDTAAAEAYRLNQAAHIIRCLVTITEDKEPPVRAFFTVERKVYESTEVILSDAKKADDLLRIALRELNAFKLKYQQLQQLKPIFEAMEGLQ